MITAKEAREQTSQAKNNKIAEQMLQIEEEIKKAISSGDTNVYLYSYLNKEVKEQLENNGYTVESYSPRNEYICKISW